MCVDDNVPRGDSAATARRGALLIEFITATAHATGSEKEGKEEEEGEDNAFCVEQKFPHGETSSRPTAPHALSNWAIGRPTPAHVLGAAAPGESLCAISRGMPRILLYIYLVHSNNDNNCSANNGELC